MLRCLTKRKIDCSFQNNEFRFKNRGSSLFFFFFGFLFFFSFLQSTLDEITKRYVKNCGFFFWKEEEKKKKKHSCYEKKKKRPGRDSNPRSSVLSSRVRNPRYTRPTPYHLATEPHRGVASQLK